MGRGGRGAERGRPMGCRCSEEIAVLDLSAVVEQNQDSHGT